MQSAFANQHVEQGSSIAETAIIVGAGDSTCTFINLPSNRDEAASNPSEQTKTLVL